MIKLKQDLAQRIQELQDIPEFFLRLEFPLECGHPLHWLHNQLHRQKIYWSERSQEEMAGAGVAYAIKNASLDKIQSYLSPGNHVRFYGGISFDTHPVEERWGSFGHCSFFVPRFELIQNNQGVTFALNLTKQDLEPERKADLIRQLNALNFSEETVYREVPQIQQRSSIPNKEQWIHAVQKRLEDIKQNSIQKIVLARRVDVDFNVKLFPSALISFLKQQTPGCYHFCFQTDTYEAFLGASPEKLFSLKDKAIQTEAVAGTIPSSQDESFLKTSKQTEEHAIVAQRIEQLLEETTEEYTKDDQPQILKLVDVQHLLTRFKGKIKKEMSVHTLLGLFHPTPALAGHPKEESMKKIKETEPFSRGWYGAPVGWVSHNDAEFAVGIRSGLIHKGMLSLYSGAGIVDESDPEEEWKEIEYKLAQFLKVFS